MVTQAARTLWSRAPVWRYGVIAAGALTVVGVASLVSNMDFSNSGNQNAQTCPPGETLDPTTGQCFGGSNQGGGGGQQPTPLPAGCPSSNQQAQPQQNLPSHVVQVTPSGPSPAMMARITAFGSRIQAADAQARQGARCEQMAAALEELETADLSMLRCDPPMLKKHAQAIQCQGDIAASDLRFDRLGTEFDAYAADRSGNVVARLARATEALTAFDESRDRHGEMTDAVDAGKAAVSRIAESDKRIVALDKAASAAESAGPDAGPAIETFGQAAEAVSAFDAGRMTEAQTRRLEDGRAAAKRVAESDARLAALGPALSLAGAGTNPGQRQQLIDAVAALTDFDQSRADQAEAAEIGRARTEALELSQITLVEAVRTIDVTTAPAPELQRLANLRSVIDDNGGLAPGAEPLAAEAYRAAEFAAARLAESDLRIESMRNVSRAWERNPGTSLETSVVSAFDSITDFDRSRLSGDAKLDFERVSNAKEIVAAMRTGLTSSARDTAPVFIAPVGTAPQAKLAASQLRAALSGEGYRIVDSREASALTLEIGWEGEDRRQISIGSRRVDTTVVTLSMTGGWTYRDEPFLRTTVQGEGRAFVASQVTGKGIEAAIKSLVAEMNAELAE
ncbi:MAG: hypothetical protein AAGG06_17655 [Pseudomonadota bacterium]